MCSIILLAKQEFQLIFT